MDLTISDSCYTDFTKMTGNIIKNSYGTLTTRECAFQCQMTAGENSKGNYG